MPVLPFVDLKRNCVLQPQVSVDDSRLIHSGALAGFGAVALTIAVVTFGIGGVLTVTGGETQAAFEGPVDPGPFDLGQTGDRTNLHTPPTETANESIRYPQDITYEEAKKQALRAERSRITRVLSIASYVTNTSVGVYGDSTATGIDSNHTSIKVRIEMPYSYEYSCNNSTGVVDGLQSIVIYQVSDSNVTVITIAEEIRNACD